MRNLYIFISIQALLLICVAGCKKEGTNVIKKTGTDTTGNVSTTDTTGHSLVFYGTTAIGINYNTKSGTIFKVNGDGSGFETLFSFDTTTGYEPIGPLCEGPNGKLYGTTIAGGPNSNGTMFSFDPASKTFKRILDFNGPNVIDPETLPGNYSLAGLTLASNGKLYGCTVQSIFSIDPATDKISFVYTFNAATETLGPNGSRLIEGSDGKLYGATGYRGVSAPVIPNSAGAVFSFDPKTNLTTLIHQFYNNDGMGSSPLCSVCVSADGNIYGMTENSAYLPTVDITGTFYKVNMASKSFAVLQKFNGSNGKLPQYGNSVIQGTVNKIYGTTFAGGPTSNTGVIFSYDTNTSTYKIEHSFGQLISSTMVDGAGPFGGLIKASNGNLYGMTFLGGLLSTRLPGTGVVYRLNPATGAYTVVHVFNPATEGDGPYADLVEYH